MTGTSPRSWTTGSSESFGHNLHKVTPHIGFLGEEEGASGPDGLQWALDPIDGTANLVRGLPPSPGLNG
ncbi:inositol monophosphatase family protein [Micromonospora sp. HM5-17]|uniref:inositol monophosphatase family protein n=1 Tax=Micromonospora sp. HM5-17 TaxID=2487710 RepID=UPI000F492637|nr:inositol monophosphatase family protein [Micromonospora sp. HM5-17]ROT31944.1 hypothetical protein EF879_09880 [Micromonospora sp. HM5-17]